METHKAVETVFRYSTLRLLGGLLTCLLFTSCVNLDPAADPTRYFILSAPGISASGLDEVKTDTVVLHIERVEIPSYLDDRRFVVRLSVNEIRFDEFARWGEPLNSGIARVVATNFEAGLGAADISYYPWKQPTGDAYRLRLKIIRFEAWSDGRVKLEITAELWAPGQAKELLGKLIKDYTLPGTGDTVPDRVRAMSDAVHRFSSDAAAWFLEYHGAE